MTNTNSIEIPFSKTKLTKFLIFSIAFLAIGIWMNLADPQSGNSLFNDPWVKTFASWGGMLMGILGIYFFSKRLLDKNPGLVLNEEGIYDNTTAFRFGLIPWSDVAGIMDRTMQASIATKQHLVTILLSDPGKYIAATNSVVKKKMLQANAKTYGSPIHISANGLKINHKELLNLINTSFERYKQSKLDTIVGSNSKQ